MGGIFYGTTEFGGTYSGCFGGLNCGTVFSITPSGTEKVLHSFSGGPDGGNQDSALISDSSGNLYGTANAGGAYGHGAVFELTRSTGSWQETVLHSFGSGKDGALPQTSLIFDSRGNLYGTTAEGGVFGWGIVFELTPTKDGWREIVLHDFAYGSDGGAPVSDLVLDELGNLYGTTTLGGHFDQVFCANGCGTVLKLTPTEGGWRHTVIYEFRNDLDGNDPEAPLIFDQQGNLYGTTLGGGNGNGCIQDGGCGTVFKMTRAANKWKETVLYRFQGVNGDGAYPFGGVVLDKKGNLFGTTIMGGLYAQQCGGSCGTFFELARGKTGWTERVLYMFRGGRDGYSPLGTLISDKSGNYFGVTHAGGNSGCDSNLGCGTAFELARTETGWVEARRFVFPGGVKGWWPGTGLTLRGNRLYGTTFEGGAFSYYGLAFDVDLGLDEPRGDPSSH